MVEEPNLYLPDECWESIFTFLNHADDGKDNHRYMESLSVVSKQFLSITNHLRFSLTICDPTRPFLHYLFKRFTNLTSLNLTSFWGDLDALLSQISCFRLNLTSLNLSNQHTIPANGLRAFSKKITTLTSLLCSNIYSIHDEDMTLIFDCFPFLEELDLSNPWRFTVKSEFMNIGVTVMSMALPKLRKVNLSGHSYINDSWIFNLCKNCVFLQEVIMLGCPFLTNHGIASAIRERPTLKSLSVRWRSDQSPDNSRLHFIDSSMNLEGLTSLDLSHSHISDDFLFTIAMRGLPLRRLVLLCCTGYSYAGIFGLLSKCPRIQHLDLETFSYLNDCLNDQHVANLSLILGNLMSINLTGRDLTNLALFALARNCPSLSEITMKYAAIREEASVEDSNPFMDFVVNPQLKSLNLHGTDGSDPLRDTHIIMLASIFPNLELLDLSSCDHISEDGILQVLRRCCKIRHLNLAHCSRVKLCGINSLAIPKLEVLNLSHTSVDDETLYVISKNCYGILQLSLESCDNVTAMGVKHVVRNCTQLREINLDGCFEVHYNFLSFMVFSRPSLRKITTTDFCLSYRDTKRFLRHGCFVRDTDRDREILYMRGRI